MRLFSNTAKFLNLAFKIEKIKTKYKNSALCLSEKLASFYTLRFIHKTVMVYLPSARKNHATHFVSTNYTITDTVHYTSYKSYCIFT